MKKWIVTHTLDGEKFDTTEIEGRTYTDAYVNCMIKYPNDMITELVEVKDERNA